MKELLKKLNKYIILLIVQSIYSMFWIYIRIFLNARCPVINNESSLSTFINFLPDIFDYSIRLIILILIIIDFRRENLRYIILACFATFLYPLLGILIFALLFLEKQTIKANIDNKINSQSSITKTE
jgi:hypothetical protein